VLPFSRVVTNPCSPSHASLRATLARLSPVRSTSTGQVGADVASARAAVPRAQTTASSDRAASARSRTTAGSAWTVRTHAAGRTTRRPWRAATSR
jgi:hypothetical protein